MSTLSRLQEKRLVILTGKGGVGKTTLSVALGIALSRMGKKVLLCEINTQPKIPSFFGKKIADGEIGELKNNLFSVHILPREAMREYGVMILKSRLLYKTIFENKFVAKFLGGFPGLNELLTLGKIRYHENQKDSAGKPLYDTIIVDAPATGHGISLLQFPITILRVLSRGPLADEEKKLYDLLTDPRRTSIGIITIPEELPVKESLELRETIIRELNMPFGFLFFNSFIGPVCDDSQRETLSRMGDIPVPIKSSADFTLERSSLHRNYFLSVSAEISGGIPCVPFIYSENFGLEQLEQIADFLTAPEVASDHR